MTPAKARHASRRARFADAQHEKTRATRIFHVDARCS